MSRRSTGVQGSKAFTLIELLVVMGIIGILASAVLVSVAPAREKARDVRRLQDMKNIQVALELYYEANGRYPQVNGAQTSVANCGLSNTWCTLETALAAYISPLPRDPSGLQGTFIYSYDSDSGDNYQTYGLMTSMENSANYDRVNSDGGTYNGVDCCYYEIGSQPLRCAVQGSGWWGPQTTVCATGN